MAYTLNDEERYEFVLRSAIYEGSKLYQSSPDIFKLMLHTDPKNPTGKKLGLTVSDSKRIWRDITSGSLEERLGPYYRYMTESEKKIINMMSEILKTTPEGTPLAPCYISERILQNSRPTENVIESSRKIGKMVEKAKEFAARATEIHDRTVARIRRPYGP